MTLKMHSLKELEKHQMVLVEIIDINTFSPEADEAAIASTDLFRRVK